jgi:allantoin racemase
MNMANEPIKLYWPIGLTREMPGRTSRGDLLDQTLKEYTQHVMGPDVSVTIGWLKKTTSLLSSLYLGMVNDVHVINDILAAERDGHHGAIVGGHWDPGLYAAREAASIPVAGPGESGMMLAGTLGRKFAMLTVMEGYVPIIENNIRTYGLESRAISRRPVRRFGMTYDNFVRCLEGKDDEFLVEFEKTARECIADGADVIIAGGQLFGPLFLKHKFNQIPNTGVPVIEVSACGLKFAEVLVRLRRSIGLAKSQHMHSPFRTPPRDVVDGARKSFGLD